MTDPARIIGFLDFGGDFDPSLLFVMLGAVLVHSVTHRFVLRRPSPLWANSFSLPKSGSIDSRLVAGSALFGIGWGLAGYCPGPALTSVFTLSGPTLVFVASMLIGMLLFALQSRAPIEAGTLVPPESH